MSSGFSNLEPQCEILLKARMFLQVYHNHSLDSGVLWASRFSCRQTQFKTPKAGNMNIRLNRNAEDIAEYPRKSWACSGSSVLFQRMPVHINLHLLCDLLCLVFGKTRVLISKRKPSTLAEVHLVFFSFPSVKLWQVIIKYSTIAYFSMIHCNFFIRKYTSQNLDQDCLNKPNKKDTWKAQTSHSALWLIQSRTEVSSLM